MEKKEPPIITKIRKINERFFWFESNEKPILDILLINERKLNKKSLLKLKKNKKIKVTIIR